VLVTILHAALWFNGHFPGKPGLASHLLLFFIYFIWSKQTQVFTSCLTTATTSLPDDASKTSSMTTVMLVSFYLHVSKPLLCRNYSLYWCCACASRASYCWSGVIKWHSAYRKHHSSTLRSSHDWPDSGKHGKWPLERLFARNRIVIIPRIKNISRCGFRRCCESLLLLLISSNVQLLLLLRIKICALYILAIFLSLPPPRRLCNRCLSVC